MAIKMIYEFMQFINKHKLLHKIVDNMERKFSVATSNSLSVLFRGEFVVRFSHEIPDEGNTLSSAKENITADVKRNTQ